MGNCYESGLYCLLAFFLLFITVVWFQIVIVIFSFFIVVFHLAVVAIVFSQVCLICKLIFAGALTKVRPS